MAKVVEPKKPLRTWASNEVDLGLSLCMQEEFQITNKGQLLQLADATLEDYLRWGNVDEGEDIIQTFYLPMLATYHPTDYLRWACEELYPEIDFDSEFETDRPRVGERIQKSEYADIFYKACQLKVKSLKEKLDELGYKLVFP